MIPNPIGSNQSTKSDRIPGYEAIIGSAVYILSAAHLISIYVTVLDYNPRNQC